MKLGGAHAPGAPPLVPTPMMYAILEVVLEFSSRCCVYNLYASNSINTPNTNKHTIIKATRIKISTVLLQKKNTLHINCMCVHYK